MTDFQTKRTHLELASMALFELQAELFPVGEQVSWRAPHWTVETGRVTKHLSGGRMQVMDDLAQFQTTIATADILRAKP